jgi:hypothetical protein
MRILRVWGAQAASLKCESGSDFARSAQTDFRIGEHMRLACWFWRLAKTDFCPDLDQHQKPVTTH